MRAASSDFLPVGTCVHINRATQSSWNSSELMDACKALLQNTACEPADRNGCTDLECSVPQIFNQRKFSGKCYNHAVKTLV